MIGFLLWFTACALIILVVRALAHGDDTAALLGITAFICTGLVLVIR